MTNKFNKYFKMVSEVLSNYITKRYERWLDYSRYHCAQTDIEDEAIDVLNEVLIMLIEKSNSNQDYIMQLYECKKGEYRELDFFVLHMIKLNITSETSPYRHKYRSLPIDDNVDYHSINIIDDEELEIDKSGIILQQMTLVREIFDNLNLSEKAKEVFSYKFFEGEKFSKWEGPEDKKFLYDTYNKVLNIIKSKIGGGMLF